MNVSDLKKRKGGLFQNYNRGVLAKMRFLYGNRFEKKRAERKRLFLIMGPVAMCVAAVAFFAGLKAAEIAVLAVGIPLGIIGFSEYSVFDKAKKKQRKLRLGLADLAERLAVLLDAGVNVWSALVDVSSMMKEQDGALGNELRMAVNDYCGANGYYYSPEEALENMAARCGDASVSTFVSLVLQNSRKGSSELASLLRLQAVNQRSERKALAKQMADEASTLMLIPSAMILAAILVLTATPAVIGFMS